MKLNISISLVILPFILSASAIPLRARAVVRSATGLASPNNSNLMSVSRNSLDASVTHGGDDMAAANSTSVDDSQACENDSDTSLDTGDSTDEFSDLGSNSSANSTDISGIDSTDITGSGSSTDFSAATSNSTDIAGSGNSTDLGIFGNLLSQTDPAMVSALRQAIDALDDQLNGVAENTTDSSGAQDGSDGESDAIGDANTADSTDSADSADDGSEDDSGISANATAAAASPKRRSFPKIRHSFLFFDDSE
ncbi:hypothetical protein M422DRAFT_43735 [Sphaerobolus stellatus SS14]|nr:hypothetical protein M422DRAFT_43735 [Sphaerobolus stellatus SS14]